MPDTLNAAEMRRLAMRCAVRASEPDCGADDRERLLRMREGLLEVAANADWLSGHRDPAQREASSIVPRDYARDERPERL
jgi:hypothetical protein